MIALDYSHKYIFDIFFKVFLILPARSMQREEGREGMGAVGVGGGRGGGWEREERGLGGGGKRLLLAASNQMRPVYPLPLV